MEVYTTQPAGIPMKFTKGYTQVYTGNGKGKTTAAIGLTVRALGAGLRVYMVQFMKDMAYSELRMMQLFGENFILERYGNDRFVFQKENPSDQLKSEMKAGLDHAFQTMLSQKYDMVILDEVLVSIYFKLFTENDVIKFIKNKPETIELVLTGRYCPASIIELADLVTTMAETKHYYSNGVPARHGIES